MNYHKVLYIAFCFSLTIFIRLEKWNSFSQIEATKYRCRTPHCDSLWREIFFYYSGNIFNQINTTNSTEHVNAFCNKVTQSVRRRLNLPDFFLKKGSMFDRSLLRTNILFEFENIYFEQKANRCFNESNSSEFLLNRFA